MNYNEITAQQCADWLAEKDGWESVDNPTIERWAENTRWRRRLPDGKSWEYHADPMPLTLDAVAGALPANMFFYVNYCILFGEETYVVCAVTKGTRIKEFRAEGPDELTARYRAAVAARMEEER